MAEVIKNLLFLMFYIMTLKPQLSEAIDFKMNPQISSLAASVDYFTSKLYIAVATTTNENVFMSPFSIATILAMVHSGAKQNSAKQLENALNITSNPNFLTLAFQQYISALKKSNMGITFNSVNRLYANEHFHISGDYKKNISKYYFSDVESADFEKNSENTRIHINDWVMKNTNNKIKDLLPNGSLTPQTMLVLINAVYFKGKWEEKFPEQATSSQKFHLSSDKTISHDFMYVSENFNTKIDSNYKVVELPYIGKAFSMFIILPNKINGLHSLEKGIDAQFLEDIIGRKGFESLYLELFMPKFRLESDFQLGMVLKQLGVSDLFDANKADLSGMTDGQKNMFASEVFHKAFVEVNEEGTEAAAATGMVMMAMSAQMGIQFNVDHPFMFLIVDNQAQLIHFIGKVTNPSL
ncbi:leukocyte elastase inhibitor-like isoform X1 [Argonauta hians]